MRITGITSRIISYDVSAIYGEVGPPQEISADYRYSFDTFHTDEGIDGRSMQFGWMGEGQAMGHVLHEAYGRFLMGRDVAEHERLWQDLRRQNRHEYNLSDTLLGTIDIALWDIRGRAAGLPIARLLGLARTTIPTYATAITVNPTPEQVFEEARLRVRQGYRGFKIQFWDGLDRDIPRFRAAREAVGPDFPLFQDAAGFYSWTEALGAGYVLDELGYRWFEEPLPDRQVFQLKRLADEIRTPVLTTETLRLHEMPEVLRIGAGDLVRGDVLLKGGITGLRKAAAAAELFGYNLEIHGMGAPLLDAANLHVALSIENCEFSEGHEALYHEGLIGSPLAIDAAGLRHLPDAPGLGVEMDMDWVDDHTVEIIRTGESDVTTASDIRGMWAAMPLPWNADWSVDAGALGAMVERYQTAGLPGAYCTGTDGEFHTLELDEFRPVIAAFAAAADRVGLPIQAGTGWVTQRGAIERTQVARDAGIPVVQVVPPFWVVVNDAERVGFYEALSAAVPDVGILVYNTERIGRVLGAAQIRAIADAVPAVVGSKYDGWDFKEFAQICAATPSLVHMPVDVGIGPSAAYPSLALCSWIANLNPVWTVAWWDAIERGDWAEADRRTVYAKSLIAEWEGFTGHLTASSALAKLCARVGILPEMPLRVREPYRAGTDEDVAVLRRLIDERYPELAYRI